MKNNIKYQSLLIKGISERVRLVRTSYVHRETSQKLTQEDFFPGNGYRISAIELEKISSGYKSFIPSLVIRNIVTIANDTKNYKRLENANSKLPSKIDAFWLFFGEDCDIQRFLKGVFYGLCEELFTTYTYENLYENKNDIEFSPSAKIIYHLFSFNAQFSRSHGLLKTSVREKYQPTKNAITFNNDMRNILFNTLDYSWSLIQNGLLELFKTTFSGIDSIKIGRYNSGNINRDIRAWNKKEFLPYIKQKTIEINENDRIAAIGSLVDKLMNEWMDKMAADKNSSSFDDLKPLFDKCDRILLTCTRQLRKVQYEYILEHDESSVEDCELHQDVRRMIDSITNQ